MPALAYTWPAGEENIHCTTSYSKADTSKLFNVASLLGENNNVALICISWLFVRVSLSFGHLYFFFPLPVLIYHFDIPVT